MVVTALVDLAARTVRDARPRHRSVDMLLDLAPSLLSTRLPMVVFTEAHLVERIVDARTGRGVEEDTVVVPFAPHPGWDHDVERFERWLAVERPLCSANVDKDTPEFLALGRSKIPCLLQAAALLDAPWYWWIDIGIAHTSPVPPDLHARLRRMSSTRTRQSDGPESASPAVRLVSLETEGWHARRENVLATRQAAQRPTRAWWMGGAQLVAGGVIGVRADALAELDHWLMSADLDAAEHGAAVSDEMLLSRVFVQHPGVVGTSPGGYGDLFGALVETPRLRDLCPSVRFVALPVSDRPDRAAFNPSIATDPDGGFRAVVRQANYRYVDGDYVTLDDTGWIITDNVMVFLDDDLEVVTSVEIDDSRVRIDPPLFPVSGLEDMRLFRHGGRWFGSATSREHRADGLCEIVVVEFGDDADAARVVSALRLPAPRGWRHEKNWAPISDESTVDPGRMSFLWSSDPAVVVTVDQPLGCLGVGSALPPEFDQGGARGGSQVVPVAGGWLTVVHRARTISGWHRVYEHRVIWFDEEFDVRARSPWFVFGREGIEFCAGLAVSDGGVVLSFGLEDREAWLASVPWDELRLMLDAGAMEEDADGSD